MGILRLFNGGFSLFRPGSLFQSLRIRTKLLAALVPSTIIILVGTGYVTNWFANQFLTEAVQRTVRLQTLALAHECESFLARCREDLLRLSEGPADFETLERFWASTRAIRGWTYAELAYLSERPGERSWFAFDTGEGLHVPAVHEIAQVTPNPYEILEEAGEFAVGEIHLSGVFESHYPLDAEEQNGLTRSRAVLRLATPVAGNDGKRAGFLILGVDARRFRDILSLYNSSKSPIFAYVRSPEVRYCYYFDTEGWILFQSEEPEGPARPLATETARSGFSGTFGKPGLSGAFRPAPFHSDYWKMIEDISRGRHGILTLNVNDASESAVDEVYVGYAPVHLPSAKGKGPVIGGVAFVDRSRLGLFAGYRQIDVIFVILLSATVLVTLLIWLLSRLITRPIFELAAAVNHIQETGELKPLDLPTHDYETSFLKFSINNMISTIRDQIEEIRDRDRRLQQAAQRERAVFDEDPPALGTADSGVLIREIVGASPVVASLREEIGKAAAVDADVLIIGETGTGKQLTAEAIHKLSRRRHKPFVSINCGALDENLLLDALFGHVRGAFSDARTDRKGAFLTAHGGTLFLDEVGTASPKVQQALLRAVAMRKIHPLGSDVEYDVDVRLIAATNQDLKDLVEKGLFREDLYYRLNVITVHTPPLREHREDIPLLAHHFLREAEVRMNRQEIGLSRGALERLKAYDWPGNVRELQNCITRAVAMTEGSLIHVQDLQLGDFAPEPEPPTPASPAPRDAPTCAQADETAGVSLNVRQARVIPLLLQKGEISRAEYQREVGDGLPARTALYDLQDLVTKGILVKTGRGPATRYRLKNRSLIMKGVAKKPLQPCSADQDP